MQKVKIKNMMSLSVETYSGDGFDFTEHTLTTWCKPSVAIQFFAFNGLAYNKTRQPIHIEDWEKIHPQLLKENRQTLFTGYTSFLDGGGGRAEGDGSYLFHCVGVEATVSEGKISIPNPLKTKRNAANLKKVVLF